MLKLAQNRKSFLFLLFIVFSGLSLHATKRYWVYSGTGLGRWNNTANWSSTSGGAGGFSVPGVNDSVYFDGNGTGNDTINANANMRRLEIAAGYTGRIVQTSFAFSVVTDGILSGGIFSGGSAVIAFGGSFILAGTAFTATSGNLNIVGNFTFSSGSFTHNNGKVRFNTTNNIKGSVSFYQLEFSSTSSSTFKIKPGTVLTCFSKLTISGVGQVKLDSGTIYSKADISVTNTSTSTNGNATIEINGTGSQLFAGSGTAGQGRLPNITINKSSGTLTLSSVISVSGNWTYSDGTVDASTNLSTVFFYGNLNLDGQGASTLLPFYNVTTAGNTVTLTGNLNVTNNLTINSSTTLSAGSNTINLGGNWNNNGTWTYSTSTVVMDGSGYNTISKASGTETFYNLTFNRPAKSHKLNNPVAVNNVLTLTKGHIKTTSTNYLELIDNATLSGGSDSAYVHGPVRKTGNDAFVFPLGDTALVDTAYHPLAMTAPSSATDQFEATYFATSYPVGDSLVDSLATVSQCEYWTLKRNAGSSTPIIYLSWNSFCDNASYAEMRVAEWNGVKWLDKGQGSISVNGGSGTVAGSLSSSFSVNPVYLAIGYRNAHKSYTPVQKSIDGGYCFTDGNILYYRYNEEYKDADGFISYEVIDVATNAPVTLLNTATTVNVPVRYGVNDLKMDLYTAANIPLTPGMYLLVVTNDKNETFQLRFNKN